MWSLYIFDALLEHDKWELAVTIRGNVLLMRLDPFTNSIKGSQRLWWEEHSPWIQAEDRTCKCSLYCDLIFVKYVFWKFNFRKIKALK